MAPQKPLFAERVSIKRSIPLNAQASLNALVALGGSATMKEIQDRLEVAGLAVRHRRIEFGRSAPRSFYPALDGMVSHGFVTKKEIPAWANGLARWKWTITEAGRDQVARWHAVFYNLAFWS